MTEILTLYAVTALVFLFIDYFGLSYLVKPAFERDIPHLLRPQFRLVPAAVFYGFYIGALLWFVSWPSLVEGQTLWWVLANGLILGALCYGTYEFTSLAVIKGWTMRIALLDTCWGAVLTGCAAAIGVWVVRLMG